MQCVRCFSFCCCCCNQSCAVLEEQDPRRRPLLPDVDSSSQSTSASVKQLTGSSLYINSVYDAFKLHFESDPDFKLVADSLSLFDILATIYRITNYRDRRMKANNVSPPLPILTAPNTPPLSTKDPKRWIFFAQAAYEESGKKLRTILEERNHQLISHEPLVGLFQPAHYLSMSLNDDERLVVIGIKGTSSLDDWLTNLWITKEELKLTKPSEKAHSNMFVHSGVLNAARFVLDRVGIILNRAFYQAGFSVVVIGHSLGAGVATVLTMLLREELHMERVQCFAFAPPPAVSRHLSEKSREYIVSIVNGDDTIPRTGVKQLKGLFACMRHLLNQREEFNGWEGVERDLDSMNYVQLEDMMVSFWNESEYDTFIAGRILFLYKYGDNMQGHVEIPCDSSAIRYALLSSNMLSDHLLDSYLAALDYGLDFD